MSPLAPDFRSDDPRYSVGVLDLARCEEMLAAHLKAVGRSTLPVGPRVGAYAAIMRSGGWRLNGDTVVVSPDGTIMDGTARIRAALASGVAPPMIVVSGVARESAASLGTQARRSATDVLTIEGEPAPKTMAAAWSVILSYLGCPDRSRFVLKRVIRPAVEVALLTHRHPGIRRSAELAPSCRRLGPIPTIAALHFLFSQVDASAAEAFLADLALPVPTAPACKALLQHLSEHRAKARLSRTHLMAVTIKAWTRYRQGRGGGPIGFDGDTETTKGMEAFPDIADLPPIAIDTAPAAADPSDVDDAYFTAAEGSRVRMYPVTLTVEMAHDLLRRNGPVGSERNRRLRRSHVEALARDVAAGRWPLNGSTLKISVSGRLIDGQHRCHAVILAGVPIRTYVVEGLEDDVFASLDSGRRRTLQDYLARSGGAPVAALGACVALLHRLRHGPVVPTHGDLMSLLAETGRDIEAALARASGVDGGKVLPAPVAAAAIVHLRSDEGSEAFVLDVLKGFGGHYGFSFAPLFARLSTVKGRSVPTLEALCQAWEDSKVSRRRDAKANAGA